MKGAQQIFWNNDENLSIKYWTYRDWSLPGYTHRTRQWHYLSVELAACKDPRTYISLFYSRWSPRAVGGLQACRIWIGETRTVIEGIPHSNNGKWEKRTNGGKTDINLSFDYRREISEYSPFHFLLMGHRHFSDTIQMNWIDYLSSFSEEGQWNISSWNIHHWMLRFS